MIFLKKIEFEKLHLFDTSILGKPFILQYIEQTTLVIPCYKPIFTDLDGVEKSGVLSFLIFDSLEYYSFEQNIYNNEMSEFIGKTKKCNSSFNQKYARNCNKLVSVGVTEAGFGEIYFSILCNNFHIATDIVNLTCDETDMKSILGDKDIVKYLVFPNLAFTKKRIIC